MQQFSVQFFQSQFLWYLLLCYFFCIAGSVVFVRLFIKNYRQAKYPAATEMHWEGTVVGVVEAVLYTTAWLLDKPVFIAIWLLIKVANRFKVKSGDAVAEITAGNLFLTGTALNILFAVVAAFMFEWLAKGEFLLAMAAPVLLMVITMGLIMFLKSKQD